jgi:hypothetical protein
MISITSTIDPHQSGHRTSDFISYQAVRGRALHGIFRDFNIVSPPPMHPPCPAHA